MSRVVLSIGSNVGDRAAHLASVVDGLADRVVAVSPVYATPPWGGVEQDDFLNVIVVADDPAWDATAWLARAHGFESAAHRVRSVRWGPRTLDVDIVTCEVDGVPVLSDDPALTLPHPRAHERAFVLVPWADVEPDAPLGVDGVTRTVAQWCARLDPDERSSVRRVDPVPMRDRSRTGGTA